MGEREYMHPTLGRLVTCETTAAIVHHVRRVGPGLPPIRLSGHAGPGPFALCGAAIAWDSEVPAVEWCVTCRSCRKVAGWPEFMETPDAR
jgi:hypothetical protein